MTGVSIKRIYYFGIIAWAQWLPVLALGVFLAVLSLNLLFPLKGSHLLSLQSYLNSLEITVLLAIGPLFLTRLANFLAALTLSYFAWILAQYHGDLQTATIATYLLLGALGTLAVLADRMPWHQKDGPSRRMNEIRFVVTKIMVVLGLGISLLAIFKADAICAWLSSGLRVSIPLPLYITFFALTFLGWLGLAARPDRALALPVLLLPVIILLAFFWGWPGPFLFIPYILGAALSLSVLERRRTPVWNFRPYFPTQFGKSK